MPDYLEPHFDRAALLLVDVQRDFIDGAMPVAGTGELVPALAPLAAAFRRAGRPIVHLVRLYRPDGTDVDAVRRARIEAGARVVAPGSPGAEIPPELLPGQLPVPLDAPTLLGGGAQHLGGREVVLWKPRWSGFHRTDLAARLAAEQVDTVVVAGCNLPNCPRATLFDASSLDLRAVVVHDAVSQASAERLADLALIGVASVSLAEVIARLET